MHMPCTLPQAGALLLLVRGLERNDVRPSLALQPHVTEAATACPCPCSRRRYPMRAQVRPSADRVHRLVHAVRALLLVPSLAADPTLNAQLVPCYCLVHVHCHIGACALPCRCIAYCSVGVGASLHGCIIVWLHGCIGVHRVHWCIGTAVV